MAVTSRPPAEDEVVPQHAAARVRRREEEVSGETAPAHATKGDRPRPLATHQAVSQLHPRGTNEIEDRGRPLDRAACENDVRHPGRAIALGPTRIFAAAFEVENVELELLTSQVDC